MRMAARRGGYLDISPASLIVHAVKQSEDGKAVIVRVANPTGRPVAGVLRSAWPLAAAELVSPEERPLAPLALTKGRMEFTAGPRKIVSIKLTVRKRRKTGSWTS